MAEQNGGIAYRSLVTFLRDLPSCEDLFWSQKSLVLILSLSIFRDISNSKKRKFKSLMRSHYGVLTIMKCPEIGGRYLAAAAASSGERQLSRDFIAIRKLKALNRFVLCKGFRMSLFIRPVQRRGVHPPKLMMHFPPISDSLCLRTRLKV